MPPLAAPRVVGFAGYLRSGKNTAADALDRFGFVQESLAKGVKSGLLAIDPKIPEVAIRGTSGAVLAYSYVHLSEYVAKHGMEAAKAHPEVRRMLQTLGTEFVRSQLGEDTWIKQLEARIEHLAFTTITDVRFENEGRWIKERGLLIWIDRPGQGPSNHSSESSVCRSLSNLIIENTGTVEELHQKVRDAVIYRTLRSK